MKRLVWMGIGVAIGVIALRTVTDSRSSLGPGGLNQAVGRITEGVYDFADAVRAGMRERDSELRVALSGKVA